MRLTDLLDHGWRLFATALSFTVFGIGGLIMGLLVFPLLFVFIRSPERRKFVARRMIGKAFGGFWEMMYVLRVLDYSIEGREHIDDQRNQLIVANHPTLIDVVILMSLFPRANCVIKEAVTRNIFMKSVVGAAAYISNAAPDELLDACAAYLETGGSLMLFPEGTRTKQGAAIEFKPGAAAVAARAGVTVLPVAIECRPLFLAKEMPWHFVPQERPVFRINILAPVAAVEHTAGASDARQTRHYLNELIQGRITSQLTSMEFS